MLFSPEENQRYARHFNLPEVGRNGQLQLKRAKVLIVGAGGLGCPIALYLASSGVGKIGIIDDDTICLSNLQRQILFTTREVSKSKVLQAKTHLEALNPEIQIDAIQLRLTTKNAREIVRQFDLILDGSDNFSTRYLVNDACVLEKKPLIFGAVFRFDAQMSVFGYKDGPCYRCLFPTPPSQGEVPNCSEAGVLGVLPGTIGTLMATEALKIILGIGDILSGELLTYDALRSQFQRIKIFRRQNCLACSELNGLREIASIEEPPINCQAHSVGTDISTEELQALLVERNISFYLLDVRSTNEYQQGHLPRSVNIPLPLLFEQLNQVPTHLPIIIYCQSGQRSARALEVLLSLGYSDVRQLAGGLQRISNLAVTGLSKKIRSHSDPT